MVVLAGEMVEDMVMNGMGSEEFKAPRGICRGAEVVSNQWAESNRFCSCGIHKLFTYKMWCLCRCNYDVNRSRGVGLGLVGRGGGSQVLGVINFSPVRLGCYMSANLKNLFKF